MPVASKTFVVQWWGKGDLDGFFGLFVDNLIQIILIVALCTHVLGMPADLVYGHIMPGVAVSLLVGNLFYAWQAKRLAEQRKQTATALPYGINTVSLFAYVLFVMLPVVRSTGDVELAWQLGLLACLGSGLIELGGAFVAGWIKRMTPRAALLATLAGIAMTFISMDFAFRIFADPLIAFAPLAFILLQYIGRLRLPFDLPAGFVAVLIGTLLAWLSGRMDVQVLSASLHGQWYGPQWAGGDMLRALLDQHWLAALAVIVPMGLFNLVGSLQNLESAEAAGDEYPVRSSLLVNGLGTITAACFGSCFPTTIYIGHPGWKAMGAGIGYSVANGLVVTLLCLLGLVGLVIALVPVEAGAAILLWIGITIAAQAFQATPREHSPAVVIGFFPALAAWGLLMIEAGLRANGSNLAVVGLDVLSQQLPITGMVALSQGFIFTSMIWAAMLVALIEKQLQVAAILALLAAIFSAIGIIHGYSMGAAGVVNAYVSESSIPFVVGYLLLVGVFITAHWHERRNICREAS